MEDDIYHVSSGNSDQNSDDSFENLPKIEVRRARKQAKDNDQPGSSTSPSTSQHGGSETNVRQKGKGKCKGSVDRIKTSKKANIAKAKESKKSKLEEEKAAKKIAKELNQMYKPGECMKYMNVEIHPMMLEAWYGDDIKREVGASGAKVISSPDTVTPGVVTWKRSVSPKLVSVDGMVEMTPTKESCDRGLYVINATDVAPRVGSHTLSQHVAQVCDTASVKLTLVVFGAQDYFKSAGKRKTKNSQNKHMTEIDLEMAITDLLVSMGCDTVVVNTPNELALLIVHFTKAVAEEPFKRTKRACDEQADFYMRGDNKNCVALDVFGSGVGRLWQQMISVLPLCSLETSRALYGQYKTPLALYEALQSPNGAAKVADIGVARAAVPGSRARRIGPEFARKLHTLFTADDGNALID